MTEPTWCSRRRLEDDQLERDSWAVRPVSCGVRAYRPPRGDDTVTLRATPRPRADSGRVEPVRRSSREPPAPTRLDRAVGVAARLSGDVGVRVAQVVLHGALRHPEGPADAD